MYKTLAVIVAVLAVLLAVQTGRVRSLQQRLEAVSLETAALREAASVALEIRNNPSARIQRNVARAAAPDATSQDNLPWPDVFPPEDASVLDLNDNLTGSNAGFESTLQEETSMHGGDAGLETSDETLAAVAGEGDGTEETEEEIRKRVDKSLKHKARALINEAAQSIESGQYEDAIEMLQESLDMDPTSNHGYIRLAQTLHKLGRLDEELQAYDDWAAAAPNDSMASYHAAHAYAEQGLNDVALAYLQNFEEIAGNDISKIPITASMYRRLNMADSERALLGQWVERAPDSPDAHRSMGSYYQREGDTNAAINEYARVVELIPGNVNSRIRYGSVLREARLYDEALTQYETAANISPTSHVLSSLADAYRMVGDTASAIATYQEIIDKVPNSRYADNAQQHIDRLER